MTQTVVAALKFNFTFPVGATDPVQGDAWIIPKKEETFINITTDPHHSR